MKKYLLLLWFISFSILSLAQDQPFRNGFLFRHSLLNKLKDSLFLIKDTSVKVRAQVGYLERSGEKIFLEVDSSYNVYHHKLKFNQKKPLRGIIESRNEDSLFIRFWAIDADNNPPKADTTFVSSSDSDSHFVLKINKWEKSILKNPIKDIPFRNTQFTAVNFPIRINLNDGTVETGFTNASISITKVYGKARIYENELQEPRYRYWGIGGMFGVGARTNKNEKQEFSINYGLTIIGSMYNVKLIIATGFENGFTKDSKKISPFIGFGFGLDIYDLVNPEIKKKE